MRRAVLTALLAGWLAAAPLAARQPADPPPAPPDALTCPTPPIVPDPPVGAPALDGDAPGEAVPWQTAWGLVGLRVIPAGPKVAPNGEEYHPNFSADLAFNFWLWRGQRLYLFGDARFWGEKSENGVTNSRDGFFGTSKREFDLSGGAAWNYWGSWEARAFGYSLNNLNRGDDRVRPTGFNDGSGFENRYYLSPEYAKLGQTGYDVTRANFLSIGFYPSKDMVGNDGRAFKPGLLLRAYLTYGPADWPCYAFADVTFIGERSFEAKLLLFDVGLAARPFHRLPQFEIRLGTENTADLQAGDVFNLWYASFRCIF